jgi:hypothetical protein
MSEQDTTQETEVTPEEAEDQNPTAEQPESQEDDGDEAWDPERAKRKIGKVNSENRALRERATKAEQKAASVDDLTKENGGGPHQAPALPAPHRAVARWWPAGARARGDGHAQDRRPDVPALMPPHGPATGLLRSTRRP